MSPTATAPAFPLRPVVFDPASDDDDSDDGRPVRPADANRARSAQAPAAPPAPVPQPAAQEPVRSVSRAPADTSTHSAPSGVLPEWNGEPMTFQESYVVQQASPPRETPARALEPGEPASAAVATGVAGNPEHLPQVLMNLRADQLQQLFKSLHPDQLGKMLQLIAPSVLQPMGIVASSTSLPSKPAPSRPWSVATSSTYPQAVPSQHHRSRSTETLRDGTSSNNRPEGSGTDERTYSQAQTHHSGNASVASDSEADSVARRNAPPTAAEAALPHSHPPAQHYESTRSVPLNGDADRRPRGRQAAPPDPMAGYRPREGHEYQPRDGFLRRPSLDTTEALQTPPPVAQGYPSPAIVPAQSQVRTGEDPTATAMRVAMEIATREAARAATMEARYTQVRGELDRMHERVALMQRDFDARLERAVHEQVARSEEAFKEQNDKMRLLGERLRQAQLETVSVQNALRHAETQAAQHRCVDRRGSTPGAAAPGAQRASGSADSSHPQHRAHSEVQPDASSARPRMAPTMSPRAEAEARRQRLAAIQASLSESRPAENGNRKKRALGPPTPAPTSPGSAPDSPPDGERAPKRARPAPPEGAELLALRLRAMYRLDGNGNHVCSVCTKQRGVEGGNIGFPKETPPEGLVAHAATAHPDAWEDCVAT